MRERRLVLSPWAPFAPLRLGSGHALREIAPVNPCAVPQSPFS